MSSTSTATTWRMARESKEWVGPITVTITVDGVPITVDAGSVKFAVLPVGHRPTDSDWADPVIEPGGTALGVQADPVPAPGMFGIWAQITDMPEIPVLTPDEVGWISRT